MAQSGKSNNSEIALGEKLCCWNRIKCIILTHFMAIQYLIFLISSRETKFSYWSSSIMMMKTCPSIDLCCLLVNEFIKTFFFSLSSHVGKSLLFIKLIGYISDCFTVPFDFLALVGNKVHSLETLLDSNRPGIVRFDQVDWLRELWVVILKISKI